MTISKDADVVSVDIHVDAVLWAAIASETRSRVEHTPGVDPDEALRAAIERHLTIKPTIVVDGEARGVEDLDLDLDLEDGDDDQDEQADDVHPEIPTTPAEIQAAFEDVPRAEEPQHLPYTAETARATFPDDVVDDDGPVPDPDDRIRTVEIETPAWVLATAYAKHRERGSEVSRAAVGDTFLTHCQAYEKWVLSDGTDAIEAIIDAVEAAND
jgi:hypothetical protein